MTRRLVRLVLSVVLMLALLWRIEVRNVTPTLARVDVPMLAIAVLLFGLCQLMSSARWQWLLAARGVRLPLGTLFRLYLGGMFFGLLLPGSVSGDGFKALALYRETGLRGDALTSVFLDRFFGLLAMLVLLLGGLLLTGRAALGAQTYELTLAGVTAACAALCASCSGRVRRLALLPLGRTRARRWLERLTGAFDGYTLGNRSVRGAVAMSMVVQLAYVGEHYLLARALGWPIDFDLLLLIYPIVTLATMLPVSTGGLGVRENTFAVLFAGAGHDPVRAVSLGLLWFTIVVVWSLIGGLWLGLRRQGLQRPAGTVMIRA